MKKRLVKVLALLLATTLVLVACGQTPADSGTTTPETPSTEEETDADSGDTTEPAGDTGGRVSVELATTNVFEGYDYLTGDPYAIWFSEEFDIETTVINMPFDVWV